MMTKRKILVVENENIVSDYFSEVLKESGYIPILASSGEEAIESVSNVHPDLILMDINLQNEMDGIQAAEKILLKFDIPVIYITGYADESLFQKAKNTQPYGYLIKPIQDKELQIAIEVALYKHQIDKQTREKEERYYAVISGAVESIFFVDITTKFIIEFNPAFQKLLGYSSDDILKLTIYDIVVDEKKNIDNNIEKILKNKRYLIGERLYRHKDGSYINVEVNASVISYGRKDVICVIAHNITEYKKLEQALRDLNQFNEEIISRAGEGIIVYDTELRYIIWNRFMEELTGVPASKIFGTPALSMFPNLKEQGIDILLKRALSGETVTSKDTYYYVPSTGKSGWFTGTYVPYYNPNGDIIGVIGMIRDITERKQAEEALRESREYLNNIVETVPSGIIIINKSGNIVFANPSAEKIFGLTNDEEIGGFYNNPKWKILTDDGKHIPNNEFFFIKVIETGKSFYGVERIIERMDKTRVFVSISLVPLHDADGNVTGVIASIEDITHRKKSENEIKKLNEDLKQRANKLEIINKELEAFTYSVSHDLKAPLITVSGFSQILLQKYENILDEDGKFALKRIYTSVLHMEQIINDLLNLSRLTVGEINKTQVNLSEIVRTIADDLKKSNPKRSVEFVIAQDVIVYADERFLKIAMQNLLGNAWKFTSKNPNARIEFGVIKNGDEITYFVKDNGAGFDMKYKDKLFGVFQRLHSPSEFEGTGIGLATVQRIIHRHNGSIWAESEVNKGATFYFTL